MSYQDPTSVVTLHRFALFLHRRRGELSRAEAFFRRYVYRTIPSCITWLNINHIYLLYRALQFSMPGLLTSLSMSQQHTIATSNKDFNMPEDKNNLVNDKSSKLTNMLS